MLEEILKRLRAKQPNAKEAVLNVIAENVAEGLEKIEDLKDEDLAKAVAQLESISKAFDKPAERKPEEKPAEKKPDVAGGDALAKALARIEALEAAKAAESAKETTKSYVAKLATDLKLKEDVVNALLKEDVTADNYDAVKAGLESSVKLVSESFGGGNYVPANSTNTDAETEEKDVLDDIEKYA